MHPLHLKHNHHQETNKRQMSASSGVSVVYAMQKDV